MKIKFKLCLVVSLLFILKFNEFFVNFLNKIHTSSKAEISKLDNKYKKCYSLTTYQKEALIGLILGDGYLERVKAIHNTRLCIEQSYPEKKRIFLSFIFVI